MLLSILSIFLLLCCSAFFSASETAYSSVNRNRLKAMSEKGSICAKWALNLFSDYDQLLSTVLIGNNIVNIATTALGTVLFVKWYGPHWGTVFSTVFLTLLVLVFGEITPKGIAREFPEGFAVFAAPGLMLCKWVLYPLNIVFTYWKRLIARTLRLPDTPKMSQEELLMLVDEVQHDGSIDKDESALLKNAIKFTEGKAEDIITHRVDIAAVPVTATRDEVGNMFKETQYSRLLVYEENLDNIVGILLLKNFH